MIFEKNSVVLEYLLRILSLKLRLVTFSTLIYQKHENYDKTIPLLSTFSQLLPIYQIYVPKRSPLLRKVVFFYAARFNIFSQH